MEGKLDIFSWYSKSIYYIFFYFLHMPVYMKWFFLLFFLKYVYFWNVSMFFQQTKDNFLIFFCAMIAYYSLIDVWIGVWRHFYHFRTISWLTYFDLIHFVPWEHRATTVDFLFSCPWLFSLPLPMFSQIYADQLLDLCASLILVVLFYERWHDGFQSNACLITFLLFSRNVCPSHF